MKPTISISGVIALFVGVGLLALGVHKLLDLPNFATAVSLHGLVGSDHVQLAAATIALLEAACGAAAVALVVLNRVRGGLVVCAAIGVITAS